MEGLLEAMAESASQHEIKQIIKLSTYLGWHQAVDRLVKSSTTLASERNDVDAVLSQADM